MCGIVGVASSEGFTGYLKRRDFLHNGLYADALRGMHSTGILAVPTKAEEEVIIHKKAMPAHDFLDTITTASLIKDADKYKYMVGHNRHATRGGITARMAHPFQHGDISLVHNGTLNTQYYLPDGSKFTSDSESITNAINVQGSVSTVPALDGAFALVWYDNNTGTLHMVRNDERPLSFGFVKGADTMLFASEKRMLDWVSLRNGLQLEKIYDLNKGYEIIFESGGLRDYEHIKHKLRTHKIYTGNTHYTGNSTKGNTSTTVTTKSTVNTVFKDHDLSPGAEYEINVKKFVPFNASQASGTIFGYLEGTIVGCNKPHSVRVTGLQEEEWSWLVADSDVAERYVSAKLTSSCQLDKSKEPHKPIFTAITPEISDLNDFAQPQEKVDDVKDEEVPFDADETFLGPKGVLLTIEEFDCLVEDGCANCGTVLTYIDHEDIKWTMNNAPICKDCAATDNLGITLH